MNYVIYRHDNAFGNSAEQVLCLAQEIKSKKTNEFKILVEQEWQKTFALLIPEVRESHVLVLGDEIKSAAEMNWELHGYNKKDLFIPSYYANSATQKYNCGWEYINPISAPTLSYQGNRTCPEIDVIIQFRERGTWDRRVDGRLSDPQRDVKTRTFRKLARYFLKNGYTVGRIGDANQRFLLEDKSFTDFARDHEQNLERDIQLISQAKLFISTDSALWPIAAGLGAPTLISNITSVFPYFRTHKLFWYKLFTHQRRLFLSRADCAATKPEIFSWIKSNSVITLRKNIKFIGIFNIGLAIFRDNSFTEQLKASRSLIKREAMEGNRR